MIAGLVVVSKVGRNKRSAVPAYTSSATVNPFPKRRPEVRE